MRLSSWDIMLHVTVERRRPSIGWHSTRETVTTRSVAVLMTLPMKIWTRRWQYASSRSKASASSSSKLRAWTSRQAMVGLIELITHTAEQDCPARKLNTEDAMDCSKWRKLIKDVRWSGWVWVGEFLLVPAYPGSPVLTAVKRLCVCVRVWECEWYSWTNHMQTSYLALFLLHWHELPFHCWIQNNTYRITAAVKYVSVLWAYYK